MVSFKTLEFPYGTQISVSVSEGKRRLWNFITQEEKIMENGHVGDLGINGKTILK
jgi:hypothetical protein